MARGKSANVPNLFEEISVDYYKSCKLPTRTLVYSKVNVKPATFQSKSLSRTYNYAVLSHRAI